MNTIVYNDCFGGFSLSIKAAEWLIDHGYNPNNEVVNAIKRCEVNFEGMYDACYIDIPRHHPLLAQCIRELGSEEASGMGAKLEILNTHKSIYRIEEYDGYEEIVFPEDINWIIID